jgi:FkbM family methyltransferase
MDFEAKLESFYDKLSLSGKTVIDVGAHVGRHTLPLARKIGPDGLLCAFEPVPAIRGLLNQNLASSGLNNVAVYPFALSDRRHVADFNFIPNLPEESGLNKRHIYNAVPDEFRILKVGVFRLDDLIPSKQPVSFMKIDVEGAELDVLRGAADLLEASRPVVAFECGAASFLGYHETPEKLFDIFSALGYQTFSIVGERMTDADAFARAAYAQNSWDYVSLPPGQHELSRFLNHE